MKTYLIILSLLILSVTSSFAEVLTIKEVVLQKNADGTVSIAFDLSSLPKNANIDLAVLKLDAGSLTFSKNENFELKDSQAKLLGRTGVAETRPDIAGKQKVQFLITKYLQNRAKDESGTVNLVLSPTERATSSINQNSTLPAVEVVLYYTLPE